MDIKPTGTIIIKESELENIAYEALTSFKPDIPKTKESRFHLPVLKLNNEATWPSKPTEERIAFVGDVAANCCLGNCCGVEGLKSGCCMLDPSDLEHILGPVDELWIKMFLNSSRAKQSGYKRIDIVIDFEEGQAIGRRFFPGYGVFDSEKSYPMLRFSVYGPRFVCRFLNPETGKCRIYHPNKVKDLRPGMCQTYLCQYIRANYLVKLEHKPNLLTKLR